MMFALKLVPRFSLSRATYALQAHGGILHGCTHPAIPLYCSSLQRKLRNYSTAADNTSPPRWIQLEPELDEALIPRKLSVSPLESWLSLRYSLPPLTESPQPQEDIGLLEEKLLPSVSVPILEDTEGSATPIRCKNDLEVRRRKMNRHKYKKLQKRTKFLKRRVMEGRGRKKQKRFEEDLKRIWTQAGLKKAPEGWAAPKIFIKQYGNRRN
uniref:Small ribosomal subunit protein mS38 n=1 Tax=Nothobranchius rachovii TaxID=451742 RepID=A0A1A8RV80_9TELE